MNIKCKNFGRYPSKQITAIDTYHLQLWFLLNSNNIYLWYKVMIQIIPLSTSSINHAITNPCLITGFPGSDKFRGPLSTWPTNHGPNSLGRRYAQLRHLNEWLSFEPPKRGRLLSIADVFLSSKRTNQYTWITHMKIALQTLFRDSNQKFLKNLELQNAAFKKYASKQTVPWQNMILHSHV